MPNLSKRRKPGGPGRRDGHQEEVWSSRSQADSQGRLTGADGGLRDVVVPRDLGRHSFSGVGCGLGRV